MKNLRAAVPGIIVILLLSVYTASGAAYLQLPGVQGESTDADHRGWIELSSVSVSMQKPGQGVTGQARQRASVSLEDVVVEKEMDSATAQILQPMCGGNRFPEVKIDLCTTTGERTQCYMTYTLSDVTLAAYGYNTDSETIPIETIHISYQKIKMKYTPIDQETPPNEAVCTASGKA